MKAFMTKAVTASRFDAGNIDYEAHEVEGQLGVFVIFERWEKTAPPSTATSVHPACRNWCPNCWT
jgi:hypothetical protein